MEHKRGIKNSATSLKSAVILKNQLKSSKLLESSKNQITTATASVAKNWH